MFDLYDFVINEVKEKLSKRNDLNLIDMQFSQNGFDNYCVVFFKVFDNYLIKERQIIEVYDLNGKLLIPIEENVENIYQCSNYIKKDGANKFYTSKIVGANLIEYRDYFLTDGKSNPDSTWRASEFKLPEYITPDRMIVTDKDKNYLCDRRGNHLSYCFQNIESVGYITEDDFINFVKSGNCLKITLIIESTNGSLDVNGNIKKSVFVGFMDLNGKLIKNLVNIETGLGQFIFWKNTKKLGSFVKQEEDILNRNPSNFITGGVQSNLKQAFELARQIKYNNKKKKGKI